MSKNKKENEEENSAIIVEDDGKLCCDDGHCTACVDKQSDIDKDKQEKSAQDDLEDQTDIDNDKAVAEEMLNELNDEVSNENVEVEQAEGSNIESVEDDEKNTENIAEIEKGEAESTQNNSEENVEKVEDDGNVEIIDSGDVKEVDQETEENIDKIIDDENAKKIIASDSTSSRHEGSLKQENVSKKSGSGFLIFIIVILLGIIGVAGFMGYQYYNNLVNNTVAKDIFKDAQVVELDDGGIWVHQNEPKVTLKVFSSSDCVDCVDDEVVNFLQAQIPTLEIEMIDIKETEYTENLKYIPAFIFDENIIKTDFYTRAEELFSEVNGQYIFKSAQVGFPIGEQLEKLPTDTGFVVGAQDGGTVVLGVTDFGCEKCAIANPILDKFEIDYRTKVKFVYKIATDTTDEKMMSVSMAAFCADEQNGFDVFSDILFSRQAKWMAIETLEELDPILAGYAASSRLNKVNFIECLSSEKYKEDVIKMSQEIEEYGLTGAPIYFVNDKIVKGVPTYEEFKVVLDSEL